MTGFEPRISLQDLWVHSNLFKNWAIPGLFSLFSSFLLTVNNCSIKVADDWIRTRVLWSRNQPFCQLCHNHCPNMVLLNSSNASAKFSTQWVTHPQRRRASEVPSLPATNWGLKASTSFTFSSIANATQAEEALSDFSRWAKRISSYSTG